MASVMFVAAAWLLLCSYCARADNLNCSALDGTRTIATRPNDTRAFSIFKTCAFPYKKLQSACMVQSCPALSNSGLCPFDSAGVANASAIDSLLGLMVQCLSASSSVCGVPTEVYDIPELTQVLPNEFFLSANLTFAPGSRLLMPWRNDSFRLSFVSGDRQSLILRISGALSVQALLNGDVKIRIPVKLFAVDEINSEASLSNLAINITTPITDTVTLGLPPTPSNPNTLTVTPTSQSQTKAEVQTGTIENRERPNKALTKILNKYFVAALNNIANDSADSDDMVRFIGTYVGLGFMEMCGNNA